MLLLSDILIQEFEIETFDALMAVVIERARGGEMFLQMDVKPPYKDTPSDWEDRLEAAFTSAGNRR